MHRRDFLAFASALLFPPFVAAAKHGPALRATQVPLTRLRTELLKYTRSLATNHAIGNAWLAARPARPLPEELLDTIANKLSDTRTALATHADMRELVALQIRRDFQAGNIVTLNGWILANTETQLCGLAHLLTVQAA